MWNDPNVNYFSEFNFETIRNSSEERITEIIVFFLYLGSEINSTGLKWPYPPLVDFVKVI